MNKVLRERIQRCNRHAARPAPWLKRVSLSVATTFVVACSANVVSAQLMSPGYVFVEVSDGAGRPVSGAAVVLYNLDGREIGSNVTDKANLASIRKLSYHSDGKLIIRVIKPSYMTLEVVFDTNTSYWQNDNVKIKLLSVSKPGRPNAPAPRKPKPAGSSKRAPPASGLSPPR